MLANEILLLKIIATNSRISLLRDRGLSHSQVAMLIKSQEDEGNIVASSDGVILTNKGEEILRVSMDKVTPRKKDQWILPQEHLYKEPLSFEKIILPKNKKI